MLLGFIPSLNSNTYAESIECKTYTSCGEHSVFNYFNCGVKIKYVIHPKVILKLLFYACVLKLSNNYSNVI